MKDHMKGIVIPVVLLCLLLCVLSCAQDTATDFAVISFSAATATSRSLTGFSPDFDTEDYYWYYTAVRADSTGIREGETSGETPVDEGKKGLGGYVGPFAYGEWKFTLCAYASYNEAEKTASLKVFEGEEIRMIITRSSETVLIPVSPLISAEEYGSIRIPKYALSLYCGGERLEDESPYIAEVKVTELYLGGSPAFMKDPVSYWFDDFDAYHSYRLLSGLYKITLSVYDRTKVTADGDKYIVSGVEPEGSGIVYVTVCDNLTTDINAKIDLPYGYKVGDVGPGGGWIFYDAGKEITTVYTEADGIDVTLTWRYLECGTYDCGSPGKFRWDWVDDHIAFDTEKKVGAGWRNTQMLLPLALFEKDDYPPFYQCSIYRTTENGVTYDDWFLPSLEELKQIYSVFCDKSSQYYNEDRKNSFKEVSYWSSSSYGSNRAWSVNFANGNVGSHDREWSNAVRPIRAFR